jgi:hypothetical protein
VAAPAPARPRDGIFAVYGPPFDLRSDLLFAAALAPTAPLAAAFPGVPFLSALGHTPLVLWFADIREGCYRDAAGGRNCLGSRTAHLYYELNVMALLARRVVFVPGIYATSALTIRLGHRYGMPKQPTRMGRQVGEQRIRFSVYDGPAHSYVEARLLGSGRLLGALCGWLWPRWVWPARFPGGRRIRVRVQATPRVQIGLVRGGQLALRARWLPAPIPLLPIAAYVRDQRMRLPPPSE